MLSIYNSIDKWRKGTKKTERVRVDRGIGRADQDEAGSRDNHMKPQSKYGETVASN